MDASVSEHECVCECVCVKWKGISLFILTAVCLTQDGKSILAGLRSFPCVGWMLILIDIEILLVS